MSLLVTIHPIRTEEDYRDALARISAIIGSERGTPENDELDVLADLMLAWEKKHHAPLPLPTPIQAVRHEMEDRGLSAADVAIYFGDHSRVSEFLAGKRPLTLEQIRRLNEGLRIPFEVLVGKSDPRWKVPANRRYCVLDVVAREPVGDGGVRFRFRQHFGRKPVPYVERFPGSPSFEVLQENDLVYMPPDENFEFFSCEMVGDMPYVTGYRRDVTSSSA